MFQPDLPIESCEEEKKYGLDRCKFARSFGDAILSYNEKESFVVGISGEWGSGKTSIVNMALERIDLKSTSIKDEEKPIIIKFNPWNFTDQNQLIFEFFNELNGTLKKLNENKIQKISEKIKPYAAKLVAPVVLTASIANPQAMNTLTNYVNLNDNLGNLSSMKDDLDNLLLKQKHKIIIRIEDIDRLNNLEIRQIFQLVKLLANFPNTIYMLEFDKDVVRKSLEEDVHADYSQQYLEKIVQVIFEVPPISEWEMESLLFKQIDELTKDMPINRINQKRFIDVYNGSFEYRKGLKQFFNTIRDVKRYINTLKFGFESIKKEVDFVDFLVITAIQIFIPELYEGIKNNKDIFVFSTNPLFQIHNDQKKNLFRTLCDDIINKTQINHSEILFILENIFPKLYSIYQDFLPSLDPNKLNEEGRICMEENFDTYFRLSVPQWEISKEEMRIILLYSDNQKEFENALMALGDKKRTKFLGILSEYSKSDNNSIPNENISHIISALMNKGDYFPNLSSLKRSELDIYSILINLSSRCKDEEKKFIIFQNAIKNAKDSLYTLVYIVGVLESCTQYSKPLKNHENILKPDEIEELKKLTCEKIESWQSKDELANVNELEYVLSYWAKWGHSDKVKDFIKDNNENLIAFITSFISSYEDENVDVVKENVRWPLHIKSIQRFIDFAELKEKVNNIVISPNFENLNEKSKFALKTLSSTLNNY